MGLLVDFHYSDNWADPGKQCVPRRVAGLHDDRPAWRPPFTTTRRTRSTKLIAGGARPDMVQIGNESTPGILIHLCDSGGHPLAGIAGTTRSTARSTSTPPTDGGAPPAGGPPRGRLDQPRPAAERRREGGQGARHGDRERAAPRSRPRSRVQPQLHQGAMTAGVPFDVFGESCYTNSPDQPVSTWPTTFNSLATQFPSLKFIDRRVQPRSADRQRRGLEPPQPARHRRLQLGADQAGSGTSQSQSPPRSGSTYTVQARHGASTTR